MSTYIALFRGINVGGKNTLPMKEVVSILEELGCENVSTYIQSGNVVFQNKKKLSDEMAGKISTKIHDRHGFEPKVLLLDKVTFQTAIKNNPFRTDDGKALHFFFLDTHPHQPLLEQLEAVQSKTEKFTLIKKTFYLYAPDGIGRSKLAAKAERCLGVPVTARNWNTVSKLRSMVNLSDSLLMT